MCSLVLLGWCHAEVKADLGAVRGRSSEKEERVPGNGKTARARLAELRRQPGLALEGGVRELSTTVQERDRIIRPSVALWVDAETGTVRNHTLLSVPIDSGEAITMAVEALVEALASPSASSGGTPALAGRISVDSPALAAALRPLLRPLGVKLALTTRLPLLEEAFTSLDSYLEGFREPFAWKLDRSLLLPLYRAAAGFVRQMPWEYMADYPPIVVSLGADGPQRNVKTLYGCVLGAAATVFGIAFYFSRAGLERTIRDGEDPLFAGDDGAAFTADDLIAELRRRGAPVDEIPPEILQEALSELTAEAESLLESPPLENTIVVYFDTAEDSDETYLAWIEQQRLPLASEDDVPTFVRTTLNGEARLPGKREVVAMTLALEAVNGFLARHRSRIEHLTAGSFVLSELLKATVAVTGDRTIEVSWQGGLGGLTSSLP